MNVLKIFDRLLQRREEMDSSFRDKGLVLIVLFKKEDVLGTLPPAK